MKCHEVKQLIAHWEKTGELCLPELSLIKVHLEGCRGSCRHYAALLPLWEREAGTRSLAASPGAFVSVYAGVMSELTDHSPTRRRQLRRYLSFAAAALLAVLLTTGLLLRTLTPGQPEEFMLVKFELNASEAESVFLVGDFTNWDPRAYPLEGPDAMGNWSVEIRLKKQQTYTYNFLVNSEIWLPDPLAELIVDDGFGGMNSIITL